MTVAYDELGRLTTVTQTAGPLAGSAVTVSYDKAGNRASYDTTGGRTSLPIESVVVVPINNFTTIPIVTPVNGGQPAVPASATSFAVAGPGTVSEGGSAVFTITKSAVGQAQLSVNFATVNGTAVAGVDFEARSGTLAFEGWETIKTVTVPILTDTSSEAAETFSLQLSSPTGGSSISVSSATTTIAANTVNQPPVAAPDSLSMSVCTTADKDVLANDSDPENNLPLTLESVTVNSPAIDAVIVSGQVRVTSGGTTGSFTATYVVKDSLGAASSGTLGVTVVDETGCL